MKWHFFFTLCTLLLVGTNAAAERYPYYPEGEQYVFRGCVVDGQTCEPVPGVEVFVGNETFTTDVEGLFVVPLGDGLGWASHIYAQQGAQVSQRVSVLYARNLYCELELGPPATLTGTVTGPSGEPVSGARIRVKHTGKGGPWLWDMVTDDHGRYVATDVVPGPVTLFLDHEAYYFERNFETRGAHSVHLFSGETTTKNLTADALTFFSGHVVGPDGNPVTNMKLRYRQNASSSTNTFVRTDGDGAFSVYAQPGTQLGGAHPEFGTGSANFPHPESSVAADALRITLNGYVRITGTVRNPQGEPLSGVTVGSGQMHQTTDSSGHFRLDAVPLDTKGSTRGIRVTPPEWVDSSVASSTASDPFLAFVGTRFPRGHHRP